MKSRAKGSAKTATQATDSAKPTVPIAQLGPESKNAPQPFILPDDISKDARIVALQNPRHLNYSRYIICPERGFFEFSKFTEPKTTPRSWLLSQETCSITDAEKESLENGLGRTPWKGYVTKSCDLFIATPIDPLFFVLSALAPPASSKASFEAKRLFLSGEDYLEKVIISSSQLGTFIRTGLIRQLLERRMAVVSDTVEAGDETMYRLNEEKLVAELLRKAKKMVEKGLPPSIEEKFVRKALEAPMVSIKREDSSMTELANEEPLYTPDTQTSASSIETSGTSFSTASTAATSFSEDAIGMPEPQPPPITAPEGVPELLRLRTALFLICSKYIEPHISESIKSLVASSSTVDFSPLDTYLAHLTKLRQEALAARSLGDFSRKRSILDDEDTETRAEKKRREDEEDKRKKAGESRGVKALKKVNIAGMKKMSDFFGKK